MIITIINQKGGVGKTTTAQALGAGLYELGHKVLFIDLDPQGNLTDALATPIERSGAYELLTTGKANVTHSAYGDVIVSSPELASDLTGIVYPHSIKRALKDITHLYDFVIIDTPPALNILSINALTASDGVIIPAQADRYSLQGIGQLYKTIQAVKDNANPQLKVLGILLTRHNPRTILGADVTEVMKDTAEALGTKLFNARIREAVAIREAQYLQLSPLEYAPQARVVDDYREFISEVVQEVNHE